MTETNFTQGPWLFHAHSGEITDSSPAENRIADVQLEDWHKLGAGYANASLIAAAPDLLESLTNLVGLAKLGAARLDKYHAALSEAESAIAKARGES